MKHYEIVTRRLVTTDQINNILADAFEHGISYWCGEINIIPGMNGKVFKGYASDALTKNYALNLYDAEGERWRKLTLKRFLKALARFPDFDFENYDSSDADRLVQSAVFGEVIYG